MTISPYEHHYQFPQQSLEFHYRLWTQIRTKFRRLSLWFYRRSRRSLFASLETTPVLPAIPATPTPPPPRLTATIWPSTGGQITRPLSPIVPPVPVESSDTQPLIVLEGLIPGDFGRAYREEERSGIYPSMDDAVAAARDKLIGERYDTDPLQYGVLQRSFPDLPAWHRASDVTLKRICLVKPSPLPKEGNDHRLR